MKKKILICLLFCSILRLCAIEKKVFCSQDEIPPGWLWEEPTEGCSVDVSEKDAEDILKRLDDGLMTDRNLVPIAEAGGLFLMSRIIKEPFEGTSGLLKNLGNYYLMVSENGKSDKKIFPFDKSPYFPVYYDKYENLDWEKVYEDAVKYIDGYARVPRNKDITNVFLVIRSHEDLVSYNVGGPGDYNGKLKLALDTMDENPDFYWTCEQGCLVYAYWVAHPEDRKRITEYVRGGRLEIMAPWQLFYGVWEHGESLIESIKFCQEWVRKTFGVNVDTLCRNDAAAQPEQLPQMAAQLGIKNIFFHPFNNVPYNSEFIWKSRDGSSLFAHKMLGSYSGILVPEGYGGGPMSFTADEIASMSSEDFYSLIAKWIEGFEKASVTNNIHIPVGGDFCPPVPELVRLVRAWNKEMLPHNGYRLILATPGMLFAAVKKELKETDKKIRTIKDRELGHPWWPGAPMQAPFMKEKMREAESKLIEAEKIAAFSSFLGMDYPDEALGRAWMLLGRMYYHDGLEGTIVHANRAGRVIGISDWIRERSAGHISGKIDTSDISGTPLIVFNSLSWERDDVVRFEAEIPHGFESLEIIDMDTKKEVPYQITAGSSGGKIEAVFIAEDVPSMGYKVYSLQPSRDKKSYEPELKAETNKIENKYYSVEIKPEKGGLISIWDKEYGKEVLHNGGLIYEMVEKSGQHGEQGIYPQKVSDVYNPSAAKISLTKKGPLMAEIRMVSEIRSMKVTTVFTIYEKLRRVDFNTSLRPKDRSKTGEMHTYVVTFPSAERGICMNATPYGSVKRRNIGKEYSLSEYCTSREFCDSSSDSYGLALFNHGVQMCRVRKDVLKLAFYRFGKGSWWDKPYPVSADYALYPHFGNWKDGEVYKKGVEYNFPLMAVKTGRHKGELPGKFSFLTVEKGNAMVSRVKRDADAVVLRVFENRNEDDSVKIRFFRTFDRGVPVSLYGESKAETMTIKSPLISMDLKPGEIATFKGWLSE